MSTTTATQSKPLKNVPFPSSRRTQDIVLTAEKAQELIGQERLLFERPFRSMHADNLEQAMIDDTFNWQIAELIFCECAETQKTYRCNGQHTLTARLRLPATFGDPAIRYTVYEADNFDQVRKLYGSLDRGAPRQRSHVASSFLVGKPPFNDTPATAVKQLVEGFSFWQWSDKDRRAQTIEYVADLMLNKKHREVCRKAVEFYGRLKKFFDYPGTKRAAVIGALFTTLETSDLDTNFNFWQAVVLGTKLDAGDPRHTLREKYLIKRLIQRKKNSAEDSEIESAETVHRYCLTAWNAWRNRRKVTKFITCEDRPQVKA